MLDLFLAVCCSLAIGMLFKHAGRQRLDRTALLTVNYAAAVALALVLLMLGGREVAGGLTPDAALIALSVVTGALLIAGFFVLSLATDIAGMSLAIGVMRVSVVIPFLMSWIIWDEVPTAAQLVGLMVAGVAFFLIAWRRRPEPEADAALAVTSGPTAAAERTRVARPVEPPATQALEMNARVFGVLMLVFLAGGAVDVSMKAFEESFGARNSRVLFLLLAFGIAFLIGLTVVLWRGVRQGRWPTAATVGWGVVLGLINYGSLEFILRAINQLPGTFVFPVNNIAIVLLAAALGVWVWGERLTRLNRIGLGLAVVALLLLNL
jgi:drug/metabolite transporter (DMT)-like permease